MRRALRPVLCGAGIAAALLSGCSGSGKATASSTTTPAAGQAAATVASTTSTLPATTTSTRGPTTTGAYQTPSVKQPVTGGTLTVSYAAQPIKPGKNQAPAPAGTVYSAFTASFCAAKDTPIAAALLDPSRFQVEVPGQGLVAWSATTPPIRAPLPTGVDVPPGKCLSGAVHYVIGGEQHVEAILYDSPAGLLRWAS